MLLLGTFLTLLTSINALPVPPAAHFPVPPAAPFTNNFGAQLEWVDCTVNVPAPVQQQFNVTTWNATGLPTLPSTLACGHLTVPLDYSAPISDSNNITLGFAMHRPGNASQLLNFNPGGPGLEAASFAWGIALNSSSSAMFDGVLDQDFLAVDVRGVGQSNPLNCSLVAASQIPIALPTDAASFAAYQASVAAFAQSCVTGSSPPGIVQHVGTQEVAQDWNTLMNALNYTKMNFLGVSYGTFQAAEYASRFPESVGNFVLDAVLSHATVDQIAVADQITAVNRLVLRADDFCQSDPSCPFKDQGNGSVPEAFTKVIQMAENGSFSDLNVTATLAKFALYYTVNSSPDFPKFNLALSQALNGNATLLVPDPVIMLEIVNVLPIICADEAGDDNTLGGLVKLNQSASAVDTLGFQYSQFWQLRLMCTAWPFSARPKQTLHVQSPMLFVTADYDLNTPTELATLQWQDQSPQSTLVVRHGDDHGTTMLAGQPASQDAIAFLSSGTIPQPTEQQLVSVYAPGSQRPPVTPPYVAPIGKDAGDLSTVETISF